ncbi:HEAT repeat domain-containing protein [Geothrix sp. 21YS21S-4]|uniref:HEAT repeat domain-containing protein n=1 Tax=Geothrix sp. 21YS21S-4 TaxID=3068889 RepID=UPI0027B9F468|nr:HEAT repeat domain-containing protein [Geothrix sp. 21YS21S-4]
MKQSSFELFLDRLDPTERTDQLAFFRLAGEEGLTAIEELAPRVQKVSCSPDLKRLVVEFSYYHPWPQWLPVLTRLLRHDKDLALFETGARAVGRMRTPASLAALKELALGRATAGFREAVETVLLEADPAEAFQHHFSRLLQGSAQPSEANEGAHQLAKLLTADSLEPLKSAAAHPDPLVFRHALRLLGQVPSDDAAGCLLDLFREAHREALEEREVRALFNAYRSLPRAEVLEKARQALALHQQERQPQAAADLASQEPERLPGALAAIRASEPGRLGMFLVDTVAAALEEKPAVLGRHLGQAGDSAVQRARRLDFTLDTAAQGLAALAVEGRIGREHLLEPFAESLRQATGHAGVAAALARLVSPSSEALLDLLLDLSDGALRSAALEVLGERKDPELRPALLKARKDAITDLADRSLWHLGQLPDPEGAARAFLADPEDLLMGLRFTAMHRLEALVPDLLALAATNSRETVLLAVLEALGAIGSTQAVEPLLELLHSGQAPRIQLGLAEALRNLGDPSAALALSGKAAELNISLLHAVAVEALVQAHGPHAPLPHDASGALLRAVHGGWADRHPWPLRRRIADALLSLHAADENLWPELSDLLQATLAKKHAPGEVALEDLVHLQSCARALAQLASA